MWGCGFESDETSMVVLLLGLDFEFDLIRIESSMRLICDYALTGGSDSIE